MRSASVMFSPPSHYTLSLPEPPPVCIWKMRGACSITSEYTDQYITPRRITAPMDLLFWSTSCQSTFVHLRFNIPGHYITNIPARHSRQEHEAAQEVRQTFPSCSLRSLGE